MPTIDTSPRVEDRAEQHYVAIAATVEGHEGFGPVVDTGFPELLGWLAERGVEPQGAFIRYRVVDGDERFEIEMGADVAEPQEGAGRVEPGTLPAGRYATVHHVGGFDGLDGAREGLLAWAASEGVEVDRTDGPGGTTWAVAVERYLVDPSQEPDPSKWVTELVYLVRG